MRKEGDYRYLVIDMRTKIDALNDKLEDLNVEVKGKVKEIERAAFDALIIVKAHSDGEKRCRAYHSMAVKLREMVHKLQLQLRHSRVLIPGLIELEQERHRHDYVKDDLESVDLAVDEAQELLDETKKLEE